MLYYRLYSIPPPDGIHDTYRKHILQVGMLGHAQIN